MAHADQVERVRPVPRALLLCTDVLVVAAVERTACLVGVLSRIVRREYGAESARALWRRCIGLTIRVSAVAALLVYRGSSPDTRCTFGRAMAGNRRLDDRGSPERR